MCLPKVSRGSLFADGRGRGDPERLAESKWRQRGDGIARAVAEIWRTIGTYSEEHRGCERSGERLRVKQRHRFSRFIGETRRSEHQVWLWKSNKNLSRGFLAEFAYRLLFCVQLLLQHIHLYTMFQIVEFNFNDRFFEQFRINFSNLIFTTYGCRRNIRHPFYKHVRISRFFFFFITLCTNITDIKTSI